MHLIRARRLVPVVVKAIAVAENVAINCRCYLKRKDWALAAGLGREAAKQLHLLLLKWLVQVVAGRGRRDWDLVSA